MNLKKCFLLLLIFMLTATLSFAAGSNEEETVARAESNVPQYGGTVTTYSRLNEPPSPDIQVANALACNWLEPMQQRPLIGDWEQYGPNGTGEWKFQTRAYVPDEYLRGDLLESWEVTPEKAIWHVRQGVYWSPNEQQSTWMERRELTADDIVYDLQEFIDSPWGGRFNGMVKDVYATDKYTAVIEFDEFSNLFMYFAGYEERAVIAPPELANSPGGPGQWENQVGTGPFMFEEYVVGSHMSYVRNPDYWGTTTIDGIEYELPFIDRLTITVTPDASTRLAALRTGKFDIHELVPTASWSSLDKTNPELLKSKYSVQTSSIDLQTLEPPFNNRDVRRAMMIGTDLATLADFADAGDLPLHCFPTHPDNTGPYTPFEELPADAQLLYDYNPELALQMLADAGYPDGFEIDLLTLIPDQLDEASLIADMWSKIGVTVNINPQDFVSWRGKFYSEKWSGAVTSSVEVGNALTAVTQLGGSTGFMNHTGYANPVVDEISSKVTKEFDLDKQNAMLREAGVIMLNDAAVIPLHLRPEATYWWPWLKNYYGEVSLQDGLIYTMPQYWWIDQDMKADMGY